MGKRRSKTTQEATDPRNGQTAVESPLVATPALSRFQKHEIVRMARSEIKEVPWNPRTISDNAKKRLRKLLERNGLVQTLVVNKRTGGLVSGHQRIKLLDDLEGSQDYSIDVSQIDVDERREKELNVALNAPQVSGDYDLEALGRLFKGNEISVEETGFEAKEVYQLFGVGAFADAPDQLMAMAAKIREAEEHYKELLNRPNTWLDTDFYLIVVFKDHAQRLQFTDALELPDEREIDGRALMALIDDEPNDAEHLSNSRTLTEQLSNTLPNTTP